MTVARSSVAVVTGASGGIGSAVARALAGRQMSLCLTGRDSVRLRKTATAVRRLSPKVVVHAADLSTDDGIGGLVTEVEAGFGRLDLLVCAAGTMRYGNIESVGCDDLDAQFRVNLRAPFLLTKAFLPLLERSRGQIVFVNSTAGLVSTVGITARSDNGVYAAIEHALASMASSIRDHVNPLGIRVVSVFPGRTATAMQREVCRHEGRRYKAADFLKPGDVAEVILAAVSLPRTAEMTDVVVRPMKHAVVRPTKRMKKATAPRVRK